MTNKETHERLDNIFKRYENTQFKEIVMRGWVYCENEKEADVLFVGINPSYTKNAKPECYSYQIENAIKPKREGGYKRHYGVFEWLASGVTDKWAYMDLFYYRETGQEKIDKIMREEGGLNFVREQLQLSFEILQDISPKVIVVCNKRIHDFFGKNKNIWMGFEFKDTEKEDIKTIVGMNSNFIIPNQLKKEWNPKIVFSRHLTRTKKELRESLKESIEYALHNR